MYVQAKGGSMIELDGVVDSGATHTVLSLKVAEDLGITDLREAPDANLAGGMHVPTWITDTLIRAQAQVPPSSFKMADRSGGRRTCTPLSESSPSATSIPRSLLRTSNSNTGPTCSTGLRGPRPTATESKSLPSK
jgi:hypothetical protein